MSVASSTSIIDTTLEQFVKRRRRVRATGVLCLALSAALAWLIGGAIIDRVAQLPVWGRSLVLGGFLLLLALAVGRGLVLLLSRQFNRLIAARQIESMEPSLRDALITVVSQEALPPAQRASAAMVELVKVDVADHLERARPHRRMTMRHARPAIAVLVFVLVTALILACIPWLGLPQLVMRQLMPLADIPPVTTTHIEVSTGSLDLPQGQSLAIVADVTRNEGPVTLLVGENPEQLQPIAMARVFGDRYTVTLPTVERDFTYRVEAGDARSMNYAVRVLRRPGVAKVHLDLTFPKYVGKPPLSFDLQDGKIEAVRGTIAKMTITSTEPLRQATFELPTGTMAAAETIDPYVRTAEFVVDKSGPWSALLISDRGVAGGSAGKQQQIVAVEDRAPIVQFLRNDLRMHPSDVVAVPFQTIDDFGIESLQLDVVSGAKTLLSRPMNLSGERRMIRDVVSVDLAPFALAYGDVVTLTLTAVDGAKQTRASTPPCRVLLSPRSVDPRVLRHIDALQDAVQLTESAVNRPADAALSVRAILKAITTSESPQTSDALEASLDEMQQVVSRLARQDKLSDQDQQLARQAAERLRKLQRGQQAKVAGAELENIKSAEDQKREQSPAEREAMKQSLQRAQKELAERLKELNVADNNDTAARLKDIADQASNLNARRPPIEQIAGQWSPKEREQAAVQRERVAMAAQAEVLRSDSDLAWARDLQLLARAMAKQQEDRKDAKPALREAAKSLEQMHQAVRANRDDRAKLAANADKARDQLRKLAGDTDAQTAQTSKSPLERALDKSAKLQDQHDESADQSTQQKSDEPEKWQPPAEGDNAKAQSTPAERRAQELNRIAKQQKQLSKRTESAAQEAAPTLAGEQQQIAGDLQSAEKQQKEEDFFDQNQTPQREESLEAMRQAQRALSDLPQQLMQLRQQAEQVQQMKKTAEQANSAAENAPAAQQAAAERNAAQANRMLNDAQADLDAAASSLAQSTEQTMSSAGQKMGAMGKPMQSTAEGSLSRSMQSLKQGMAAGDMVAADREQSRVLDAIADLQGTLRAAQRKTVDRDPLVAARFYAQKAQEALAQRPPNLTEAKQYQKQTSAALEQAWDQSMNQAVKDRLAQLPSFRSLLMDDFLAVDGTGDGELRAAIDRSVSPQWGRLRENTDATATTGGNAFVPPGYEEALRAYFQTLDKARSTNTQREDKR